jgi:hypothetical protein
MSQFACPLCGKNSSIKQYDPDELDLDLKVVTYGSTGRGGIYVADKSSILGQGDPLEYAVAERTLKLTKMFLDAGTFNKEHVLAGLGLSPEKAGVHDPSKVIRAIFNLDLEARNELDQLRKQDLEERRIKTSLLDISGLCNSEFRLSEDLEIILQIHDTAKHDLELIEIFYSMDNVYRNKVFKRINTENHEVQNLLEGFANIPEKKDLMETLIDTDFNFILRDDPRKGGSK